MAAPTPARPSPPLLTPRKRSSSLLKVLVYSDDRGVRQQVLSSLGRRPDQDLPAVDYVECATEPMVITRWMHSGSTW